MYAPSMNDYSQDGPALTIAVRVLRPMKPVAVLWTRIAVTLARHDRVSIPRDMDSVPKWRPLSATIALVQVIFRTITIGHAAALMIALPIGE